MTAPSTDAPADEKARRAAAAPGATAAPAPPVGGTAGRVRRGSGVGVPLSLRLAIAGNFVLRVSGPVTALLLTLYLADINEREYRIDAFAVGLLTGAFYVTELLGAPLLGAWGDRRGRRGLLLAGPLLAAAALGITAATTAFAVLLLTRLLEGISTAATVPTILGQLSAETDGDAALRARVLSLFEVTTTLGALLGTAVGPFLWAPLGRWAFVVVALAYVLAAVLFLPTRDRPGSGARPPLTGAGHPTWRESLALLGRQRALLRFFPAWLCLTAITGMWFSHAIYQMRVVRPEIAGQYLAGRFAGNTTALGMVVLAFALTFSTGILLWGYVGMRRRHEVTVMRIGLFAMLGVCASLWVLNHSGDNGPLRVAATAVFALLVLAESGFAPAAVAYLARLSGAVESERGLLMGIYTVVTGGGSLLSASLGAPFAQRGAIDGVLLATVLLAGIALTLLFRLSVQE